MKYLYVCSQMVAQYLGYTHRFELLSDTSIHWPNDAGPAPNMPLCGFQGELCISHCKLYFKSQKDKLKVYGMP